MDFKKTLLDHILQQVKHKKQRDRDMSTLTDIETLIVRSDDIRGGRPRIAGTGVTVRRIVGWYQMGLTPDEITDRLEHLTLAQVQAALAYFHANQAEIEADIAAEESEARQFEQTLKL